MTITKTLPLEITHLDIIKTLAVLIMVIDHIGFYFFPDQEWFRAIGRIGMPVWFFLVGYASSRELSNKLLIGALILAVADLALFQRIFPFSALVTIITLRFTIDYVMNFITQSRYAFIISTILIIFFYYGTNMVMEYGTMALAFTIIGYMVRNKDKVFNNTFVTQWDYYGYIGFVFIAFCVFQSGQFHLNEIQTIIMTLFTGFTLASLVTIKPMTFPQIKDKTAIFFLQFCGRKTLEIYVAHLVLFKVVVFVILALK